MLGAHSWTSSIKSCLLHLDSLPSELQRTYHHSFRRARPRVWSDVPRHVEEVSVKVRKPHPSLPVHSFQLATSLMTPPTESI